MSPSGMFCTDYLFLFYFLIIHWTFFKLKDQDGIEDVAMCVCDVRRMLKPGER